MAGYVEIRYFLDFYAFPKFESSNPTNLAAFKDVSYVVDESSGNPGYEYLFYLTGSNGGDPDPNSLYNLDTLKALCDIGEATPNILKETHLTYGIDLILDPEWTRLAQTLGFTTVGGVSDE